MEKLLKTLKPLAHDFKHWSQVNNTHPVNHFIKGLFESFSTIFALHMQILLHLNESIPERME